MLHALVTFLPVAALLSVTPGAATGMVVRSAVRGGRRHAFYTTAGTSVGVLAWGCFAAVGIATIIATSAEAFTAIKVVGAVFLIAMGAQSLRGRHPGAVFPSALGIAAMIVAFDLVWYSTLAFVVPRARRTFVDGPWQRRIERLTGAVLVGLGVRLAFERR